MANKFFTTKNSPLDSFFDSFGASESQRQEIDELIQSILLKNMLIKSAQINDKKFVVEGLKLLNQNSPEAKKFVVTALTTMETSYYDLIQEFLPNLTPEELMELQQLMKKE